MGRLHLKNVVFPAVLVSCAVFSSLTLPFTTSESTPVNINAPLLNSEFELDFRQENKGAAIRYIGAAIVLSVGSGMATVELLRRLQAATERSTAQSSQPAVNLQPGEIDASPAFDGLEYAEGDQVSLLTPHPEVDPVALASEMIPILHHPDTCRIRSTDSDHTQLAVVWQENYYHFFRVRETQTEALAIAQRLIKRGNDVIVAQLDQGFAVWVKGAESPVELVS